MIMNKKLLHYLFFIPLPLVAHLALVTHHAEASELNLELGASLQFFPHETHYTTNYANDTSAYIRLEYDKASDDGRIKFMLDAQANYSHRDQRRRRGDFSEFALGYFDEHADITLGILTEFWGVTESRHLVDIINQTNVAENIDEEIKRGQPMVKAQLHQHWGNVQFYWLPIFRERIYPSDSARLAPGDRIDYQRARYESSAGDKHQDLAIRYTHTLGAWDIGIAHFKGTSREPLLLLNINLLPRIDFTPYYEQIDQSSLDVQMTTESLLLKLEAISRTSKLQSTYQAAVVGFEYTQVGLLGSAMDLGYIAEYLYDERGSQTRVAFAQGTTPFADDVFIGGRLVENDIAQTTYLLGAYVDRDNQSTAWRFEMDTRLQDGLTLSLEGQVFARAPRQDLLYGFRDDDYLKIGLQWFF